MSWLNSSWLNSSWLNSSWLILSRSTLRVQALVSKTYDRCVFRYG